MPVATRPRQIVAPSLVLLAAGALRDMIVSGDLRPGERLTEEPLTKQLGVSRVPLREAMRILEREGLITTVPRHGSVVTALTREDVHEIMTLRATLERMAMDLAIPVTEPARLLPVREALYGMEQAHDAATLVRHAYDFHLGLVRLAGHRRLEEAYRSLALQMRVYIFMNFQARARQSETIAQNAARHRRLLALIEAGDRDAVLAGLEQHGHETFLKELTGTREQIGGGVHQ
jgi:DNA-binding GntR family transcriptional regulator